MRTQYTVSVHFRIIKKAVPGLEFGGIEGLRKRTLRSVRELSRERDQTLRQTSVAQLRRAKLIIRPIIVIVRVRQCRSSLQGHSYERKVNIVRGSLKQRHTEMWVNLRF